MTINPKDFTYKISDYFILASGSDGALKKIRLPFRNNNIFLAEKDFRSFAPGYINCSLFNTAAPGKAIAVFRAIFPDADEKSLLKDMALSLKEENAGNNEFNDHQVALHLAAYLKATYGTIKESNLLSWIQSNL